MKLIVGLGNPGSKYEHTRHNIGFEVIDALSEQHQLPLTKTKFNALYGKGKINNEDVLLVKPLTYMNLSGEAVAPLMNFYKLSMDDLLVIYDDMDLAVGKIRLRQKGSAGGHNGIKSLIAHLGTQDFKRIRVGIGRPDGRQPVIDYVLQRFGEDEMDTISQVIKKAQEACVYWTKHPFDLVMNRFNS
ncbi:PTH1 family peptidyl-tRNA hydrolase [Scopulibacillus daqui]|uniref:Peptidyl-tRNA hydrolase n=1 Tax=Scopulibacillus daqui TaxID=1469162 RepID=A0ABS2Q4P3_9BACL|nr:aminoacyl-tRNA hydrolase [Scopulibacillus daqui]MBM7646462.1 PTH1 family peptidyl-tRNA hydrolase [Scopulibacillus daqui]